MKLTQTQRDLLEKAARKPKGTLYAMTWYSTSSQHLKTHGGRKADALLGLVTKGLADNIRIESNHGPNRTGFGSVHATEYGATITEAGRQALAALQGTKS